MTPKQEREMIISLYKMNNVCDQINQIDDWYNDNVISTRRYNQWQRMVRMWKDKSILEEA
jgi:hypothetical protein